MAKLNWNILVKSRNNAEAARDMLAAEINPDDINCLQSTDLDFIAKQDYITAVPIEIALSVEDRKVLRRAQPEIKWIVTGVSANDITNLVVNYGYKVLEPPVPEVEEKSYFSINGKEVSEAEFTKIVNEAVQNIIDKFFC